MTIVKLVPQPVSSPSSQKGQQEELAVLAGTSSTTQLRSKRHGLSDAECVEVAQAFSSELASTEKAHEAVAWSLRVIEAVPLAGLRKQQLSKSCI